jgi:asparagine synthetase B (glutamine-hydrolysing)
MCGIAGVYLRDPKLVVNLDDLLDTMLDRIEHRGGDATGFIALGSKGVAEWHRAACDVRDFIKYRRPVPKGTRTIMAHTRFATQGLPAFMENNHPIRRGSFYVVHNGHVSNDQQLFKLAGRERFGQVDSEAIPARLASLGSLDKTAQVMEEIQGAAAIAAVDASNPRRLVLARGNSSPLYVLVSDKVVMWGSTQDTVKVAYKKHIGRLPKHAKIESVPEGTMLSVNSRSVTRTTFEPYRPAWQPLKKSWWQDDFESKRDGACSIPLASKLPQVTTIGGWPKWDEKDDDDGFMTVCDCCGAAVSYMEAAFEHDAQTDLTWAFCDLCAGSSELVSENPAEVSAAILAAVEDD